MPKMISKSDICMTRRSQVKRRSDIPILQSLQIDLTRAHPPIGDITLKAVAKGSHTSSNDLAQAEDMKECDAPVSNKTCTQELYSTKLPSITDGSASSSCKAKILPVAFWLPLVLAF